MDDSVTIDSDGKIKIKMNVRGRLVTQEEFDKEIKDALDKP